MSKCPLNYIYVAEGFYEWQFWEMIYYLPLSSD